MVLGYEGNETSDSIMLLSSNIPRKMLGEEGGEQGKSGI